MAEYQSKIHQYICSTFRWVTFASVLFSLIIFLVTLWWDGAVDTVLLGKAIMTTVALGCASLVVMLIFAENASVKATKKPKYVSGDE